MLAYIVRRLALIIPTLFGIMVINFIVIQAAPGGPIEQLIANFEGTGVDLTARVSGAGPTESLDTGVPQGTGTGTGTASRYRGAQGLDPDLIKELERQFGFDKPAHERFFKMIWDYARFDFGAFCRFGKQSRRAGVRTFVCLRRRNQSTWRPLFAGRIVGRHYA